MDFAHGQVYSSGSLDGMTLFETIVYSNWQSNFI